MIGGIGKIMNINRQNSISAGIEQLHVKGVINIIHCLFRHRFISPFIITMPF